ncbi:MAG: hypothetical protein M3Q52_09625 [Pseudomonadota bacterium]|nr:hypothetical protein [Pseudomonadota bacterium]
MIATDKLLFLHLHKSGGTFVNALLLRCVPSAEPIGYHLPYRQVPAQYRDRPVVGTVRSPWAYYVSWYHFQADQREPNILFRICSDEGKLDFKGTIANLVDLSGDEGRLAALRDGLPDHHVKRGLNLTKTCVDELRERGLGFYSFLYARLYAGASEPQILRVEGLREELRATLSLLGHLPNDCAEQFLDEAPPLNVSKHLAPSGYFDGPLAALVAERDHSVIDRYGYTL